MARKKEKLNAKDISKKTLTTIAKQDIIINKIVSGVRKAECMQYIMDEWGYEPVSAKTFYHQCFAMIYTMAGKTKEDIKDLSLTRLEGLYDEIEDGGQVKDKLKTIDLMNKTAGVYEETKKLEITNGEDEEFRFEIGSADKKE